MTSKTKEQITRLLAIIFFITLHLSALLLVAASAFHTSVPRFLQLV